MPKLRWINFELLLITNDKKNYGAYTILLKIYKILYYLYLLNQLIIKKHKINMSTHLYIRTFTQHLFTYFPLGIFFVRVILLIIWQNSLSLSSSCNTFDRIISNLIFSQICFSYCQMSFEVEVVLWSPRSNAYSSWLVKKSDALRFEWRHSGPAPFRQSFYEKSKSCWPSHDTL